MRRLFLRHPGIQATVKAVAFFVLLLLFETGGRASTVQLMSGNRLLPHQYAPILTSGGFFVPLELATLFGGEVSYEEGEWLLTRGQRTARLKPGARAVEVGDSVMELSAAPIEKDHELFVPLRFLGDFMGLRVFWDVAANTLDITPWTPLSRGVGTQRARQQGQAMSSVAVQPAPVVSGAPIYASLVVPPVAQEAAPVGLGEPASATSPQVEATLTGRRSQENDAVDDVKEAVERLLGRLVTPRPASREWSALRQATGVAMQVIDQDGMWAYRLEGVAPEEIKTAYLVDPDRLIVDLPKVKGAKLDPYTPPDPSVRQIRAVEWEGGLRLIFDFVHAVGHRVEKEGEAARIVFYRPLTGVHVDAGAYGGSIRLDVTGQPSYEIYRLTDPDRLVVDLRDTSLVAGPVTVGPLEGPVTRVRAAQNQPEIARVVLDVASDIPVEVLPGEEGLLVLYGDHLGLVAYRNVGPREFHIGVTAPAETQVRVHRLYRPDRLVMDVEGLTLPAPLDDQVFLEGPVSRLRVSQFNPTTVRVVADLRYHVRYAVRREQGRHVLVLEQPVLKGKTITVDAGHGGRDGGAVGVRHGVLEKEINLDIALRLQELLSGAEAVVHMTRVDDTFIDLWARADLANETESDVLVSIHANSVPPDNTSAKGTETFVRLGEPLSERLGAALQSSVTSALNTVDRGVRANRYLVVRRANMPAALVEVAFLADPEEEELLMEPWFRQRAAEGIFNGLLRYFYPEDELEADGSPDAAVDAPWIHLREATAPQGAPAVS
ncbi:MAG TPA: N-acetylmuramoyl-L-alanine amidase [Limnochordia bacterium]|nr:N-acetylmuramoyl-L-alanine amidase [Limnochordia bacterium]